MTRAMHQQIRLHVPYNPGREVVPREGRRGFGVAENEIISAQTHGTGRATPKRPWINT